MVKRKRRAVSAMAQDVIGFVDSSALERDTSYLRRGRAYRDIADDEVIQRWSEALEGLAADVSSDAMRDLYNDLGSELRLRSIDLPYLRIKDAFERLVSAISESLEKLKQDPEAFERANDALQRDIDAFKSARDKPQN